MSFILYLPLCKKWFDLIEQDKSEEYRKESEWLSSRLENFVKEPEKRHYIIFTRGYTRQAHILECSQIFKLDWKDSNRCPKIWKSLVVFSNNMPQSSPLLIPEWGYERGSFDYVFSLVQNIDGRVEVQK
jgi:hypothetical protein